MLTPMGPSAGSPRPWSTRGPCPASRPTSSPRPSSLRPSPLPVPGAWTTSPRRREADPERKLHRLKAVEDYGPGGCDAECLGGDVRLVNRPGLDAFKSFAADIPVPLRRDAEVQSPAHGGLLGLGAVPGLVDHPDLLRQPHPHAGLAPTHESAPGSRRWMSSRRGRSSLSSGHFYSRVGPLLSAKLGHRFSRA